MHTDIILSNEDFKNTSGVHTMVIIDARVQKGFLDSFEKTIKGFLIDEEVFFGFYRTDGANLTLEQHNSFLS